MDRSQMERPKSPACEQASASVVGPDKAQNGDHVLTRDLDDDAVAMAVADGVGSRPCDWRASKVACESAVEVMRQTFGTLSERIEVGVMDAHWTVGRETGRCEGMLAAIVIAAWKRGTDEAVCAGVGDARIYRVYPDRIEQITEDDVETKTIRQDSRTSLPGASSTYRRKFLTRALGGDYNVNVPVETVSLPAGAGLVLASDGAYPLGGFESKVRRIYNSHDLGGSLRGWLDASRLNNQDDATIAVLRRRVLTEKLREEYLDLLDRSVDCRDQQLYPHLMIRVLLGELDSALKAHEEERISRCVDYMRRFSISPDRDVLADLLDRVAENPACGKDIFNRLLELARKTR